MTSATHFRYEIVRTFRNRVFYAVTLALPLVLFYSVASGQRSATQDGISFPLYFMTAMAVYGAMFAADSAGARIARDRSRGWTRQMRITPLRARTDIAAKVLTAYLIALPSVVLVFLAGASLGVRLNASQWLEIGGLLLVGLTPFVALGIVLGYLVSTDALTPVIGGVVVLFALVGGVYGFQLAHSGPLFDVMKAIPSYWLVQAGFGDYTGLWFDQSKEAENARDAQRIPDEATAQAVAGRVRGRPARVERATREEKRDLPPQLFDLTSLQREANQKLGFTAQRTLSVAQSLYEKHKLITYPRTDSRHLPKDMLDKTRQALAALGEPYGPWTGPLLADKLPMPSRVFDDAKVSDHHAILPTPKRADAGALPPDERRLYELIARRAVAAFLPPCTYDAVRVITAVDQGDAKPDLFLSTGRVERDAGWKALYRALEPEKAGKKKPLEEQEQALPALTTGDARTVKTAAVKQESTKPPAPHTDASLLYAMEHAGREVEDAEVREHMRGHGLGTPATRAAILERLIAVGYAQRRGKQLWATDKGVRLIGVAPADIASPETTGRWEKGLDDIARRAASPERFLEGIRRLCQSLVRYAADQAPDAAFEPEERGGAKGKSSARKKPATRTLDAKCPLCGEGSLSENSKAFGCSRWKQGCAFTLWKNAVQREGGPALTEALVRALLQSGSLRGSTGTLHWSDNRLSFEPTAALKLKNSNKS